MWISHWIVEGVIYEEDLLTPVYATLIYHIMVAAQQSD